MGVVNLESDLRAVLLEELLPYTRDVLELGLLSIGELLTCYANWAVRFPSGQPRAVHVSAELDRFLRRGGQQNQKVRSVLAEIERGDDLEPRLSEDVKVAWAAPTASKARQLKSRDRFLAAWGIHHLHLVPRHPGLKRTGSSDLLYVVFTEKVAFALAVLPHKAWDGDKLLRIAAENWPDGGPLRVNRFITGVSTTFSEKERVELWKAGVSVPFEHRGRIYIGNDSISLAGTSLNAAQWAGQQQYDLMWATEALTDAPERVVAELRRRFPSRSMGADWQLVVRDGFFTVVEATSGAFLRLDEVAVYRGRSRGSASSQLVDG